jgi:hypothetical protein
MSSFLAAAQKSQAFAKKTSEHPVPDLPKNHQNRR